MNMKEIKREEEEKYTIKIKMYKKNVSNVCIEGTGEEALECLAGLINALRIIKIPKKIILQAIDKGLHNAVQFHLN